MENVVLIIHLLLALSLIAVVLLQRSEGGGLGMGGGGGAMSGRAAATALGKVTWILAAAFIVTSIALTVIAAEKSAGASRQRPGTCRKRRPCPAGWRIAAAAVADGGRRPGPEGRLIRQAPAGLRRAC